MWTRGAAIRPVPRYAVVSASFFERIEENDDAREDEILAERLGRLRTLQPRIFDDVQRRASTRIDDLAKSLLVQMASVLVEVFDAAHPGRMTKVEESDVTATEATLDVEEELRRERPDETFDLEDVVAREQPAVVAFLQRVLEGSLEASSDDEVDLDDVHAVYRKLLGYVLTLSYAVDAPPGSARDLPA